MGTGPARFTNRLAKESSPYLLQHAHNPVDWYPWGDEAFEKARSENKPLLISIGYSACHWCHVMERESFENEEIAALVNQVCVPVKVDREERPDVDAIYMHACVMMTGQGGWPLNAFVTPDLKPFFVGTYFPPDARYGRPGFPQLLTRIHEAWNGERADLVQQAEQLHQHFAATADGYSPGQISPNILEKSVTDASRQFDSRWGGFGQAPKFPPDQRLALLLAAFSELKDNRALEMATKTLDAMAYGGMYDQLGGGFARYSVDEQWLIPHFEKMLYNQALLVPVYLDAYLITKKILYARVARETLDWVLRDLRSPEGMFYSALDADSEGEEGKFYVWTTEEVRKLLSPEAAKLAIDYYGMTDRGNFEHATNNPHLPVPPDEFAARHKLSEEALFEKLLPVQDTLLAARQLRIPPGTDDKCLTSWNGLMISAFCRGFQVTGSSEYLDAARAAAEFILSHQKQADGTLLRSFCKGTSSIAGVLDDYAYLADSLVDLYETTFDFRYLQEARSLADQLLLKFQDPEDGSFYFSSGEDPSLITRTKELHDGALPSGASIAVRVLYRLAGFYGEEAFIKAAQAGVESVGTAVNQSPGAFSSLLLAAGNGSPRTPQIVLNGDDRSVEEFARSVWSTYLPARLLARTGAGVEGLPIIAGKEGGTPAAYVCKNYTCDAPVSNPADLKKALTALGS